MKYKYLQAWDIMMGSYPYWIEMNQERAEQENAPLTAVYRTANSKWVTFEEVKSSETKKRIVSIMNGGS